MIATLTVSTRSKTEQGLDWKIVLIQGEQMVIDSDEISHACQDLAVALIIHSR